MDNAMLLKALGATLGVLAALGTSSAQAPAPDYPAKPVEVVIPFSAGGATDVITRLVAEVVSKEWKRPIVINNKAGATGAIGSEYVARAKPDGYTLLIATGSTHAVLPAYRKDLPYDTVTSFAPATLLAVFPNILVVNPKKTSAKNLPEFIEFAKNNTGKLTFGSSGMGSSIHLAGELFKLMTGTSMVHVPYRGSAPAVTDLLAGHIDLMFDNMSSIWSQVQEGSLRALGVASASRTPLAPDLPTIAETLPGFEATTWIGVVAPAGAPNDVLGKISRDFSQAIARPEVIKRLNELGATPKSSTPAEFSDFIRRDRQRWQNVAQQAGIKPE